MLYKELRAVLLDGVEGFSFDDGVAEYTYMKRKFEEGEKNLLCDIFEGPEIDEALGELEVEGVTKEGIVLFKMDVNVPIVLNNVARKYKFSLSSVLNLDTNE